MKNSILSSSTVTSLLAFFFILASAPPTPAIPPRRAEQRVEALLAQMTLDEKIGQMTQPDMAAIEEPDDLARYAIGAMLSGGDSDPEDISPAGWLEAVREFQEAAMQSRLGIPLLYGIDAVHGHNNVDGAVIFPHHIGLGATHNPRLVRKAAQVTAREVAGTGMNWIFGPCVAVARDARWGRTYESFSDSPQWVTRLGAAEVRGIQARLPNGSRVLSCAKHFVGDGGTLRGIDRGDTICDEATLRRIHLAPYPRAIRAGTGSIMASYSSWNGEKMHGQRYLLTDVLKGELEFNGFVVSDFAGIDQLSPDYKVAIERSINAGIDMVMIPGGPRRTNTFVAFITLLRELVDEGRVPLARIDDAVRRILRVKVEMGVFEHPFGDPSLLETVGSREHREVARQCVRESLVVLKNKDRALPMSRSIDHLQVVGSAADDLGMQCGGWTIAWQGGTGEVVRGGTTILEGIRQTVGAKTRVSYSAEGEISPGAQAVVVVVGEKPYAEMEGDRAELSLAAADLEFIRKMKRSGLPVVTVLLSGRPLALGDALENSDAFVAAWLPGTEGVGVADVILGVAHPKGKLPCDWPRAAAPGEKTGDEPLFQAGFSLSYR